MKIAYLHVDYEEWTDGTYNVQEIGLAKAFQALGHETIIVYWVDKKSEKCFTEVAVTPMIKKIYLPTYHLKHHVCFDVDLLKQYQFDLIHIQSDNLLYVPNVVNWCIKQKMPYYCYIGTIASSNSNPILRKAMDCLMWRNMRTYRKSPVFTKTPAMCQLLQEKGVANIAVAPVGLDVSVIPEIPQTKEDLRMQFQLEEKKVIVCVCALRHDKQPFDVFELAERLDDTFRIFYIGIGPMKQAFLDHLKTKEAYRKILFVGKLPNEKVHLYYKMADYMVNFNPNEIFGMAMLEAMYHGCTVIARKSPGANYIIKDGVSGYLVDSVADMAARAQQAEVIAGDTKAHILRNFTWDNTARLLLAVKIEIKRNA